jgi:acetylornithine/N-succinyldiaminopimelate aminotransferase
LINSPRPKLLRFMPALNVTHSEIDRMATILRDVIRSL